ncbi:MAG: transketolase, partial [Bacteroidales bacterium]|nr:transketolase [Bacteroidales bacterium]
MEINQLKDVASQVRRDIIRMVHACQSGHPGGSLGATDIVTALYFDQMQINPENFRMDAAGEDAFFLSNGHISPMLYSILARRGYFPVAELATFRRLGTRLQGHPTTAEGLPGIRVASGSLGQGLSVAIGLAEAKKLMKDDHIV